MPAKPKSFGSQSWGISWADIGQAIEEHEATHSCTIEVSVYYVKLYKSSPYRTWQVVGRAIVRRGTPHEVCGLGMCDVGGNKGAASMAGAYLRAILDACDNLENRLRHPLKRAEQMRLPGTE